MRRVALCFCICSAKVLCDSQLKLWPFLVFATICRTRLFVASLAQTTLAKCRRKPIISFASTTGVAPAPLHSPPHPRPLAALLACLSLGGCLTKKKPGRSAARRSGKEENFNILVDGIGAVPFTAHPLSLSRSLSLSLSLSRNFVTKINFISLGFCLRLRRFSSHRASCL